MVEQDKELKIYGTQVAPQTRVAFIGYVILLVAMIIGVINTKNPLTTVVLNITVFVLMAMFSLYVLNCTVVGKCNLYAWIYSYFFVFIALFGVIGLLLAVWKN